MLIVNRLQSVKFMGAYFILSSSLQSTEVAGPQAYA